MSFLNHFSHSEPACPTTDQVRLVAGFGETLERLRVELDEPIYLTPPACYKGQVVFKASDPAFRIGNGIAEQVEEAVLNLRRTPRRQCHLVIGRSSIRR